MFICDIATCTISTKRIKEAAKKKKKKNLLSMVGQLRPNPPPSSSMAVEILERLKKRFQKSIFFLNGPTLYPPPS